jgi:hypothetical protein
MSESDVSMSEDIVNTETTAAQKLISRRKYNAEKAAKSRDKKRNERGAPVSIHRIF